MKKKMENIQKKTNGHTWKSLFSAPCPGLFPATLRSSVLSFLLQFNPYYFPQNSQKNSSVLQICLSPIFSKTSFLFLLLFPPPFSVSRICLFNDLCCNHFFCFTPSATTFSAPLLLQPPFLPATSKSEVDSLWPLRMWHVARWDSDTWLKMWSAKTNREKVTHA